MTDKTISQQINEIAWDICDNYCKYHEQIEDYDELLRICENCPILRL